LERQAIYINFIKGINMQDNQTAHASEEQNPAVEEPTTNTATDAGPDDEAGNEGDDE
jgi:hypothetical protein